MFDLTPSPAQVQAVEAVRALREAVREVAREVNASGEVPDGLRERVAAAAEATQADVAEGRSVLMDPVGLVLVAEELGVADAGVALSVLGSVLGDLVVAAAGGPVGPGRPALALYEGFGRAPSEFRTGVTEAGGVLRLSGRKDSVVGARSAESFLVVAREGEGLGVFRAPVSAAGVTIERDDVEVGTLALGAAATAALRFEGVEVERLAVATDQAGIARAVAAARLLLPAISVGVGQAAVDSAAEWVSGRSVRGNGLGDNQGVTFPLVDADIAVSRARLLLWDIASRLGEWDDPATIERKAARAVAIGCEAGSTASRVACNTMGWRGLSQRFPAEMRYRDTSLLTAIDFDPLLHSVPVLEAV